MQAELTIDKCVENVLPVLLHQVVDVAKDSAVVPRQRCLVRLRPAVVLQQRRRRGSGAYHIVLLCNDCKGYQEEGIVYS